MALIKCKECEKEISSNAKSCPNCGNLVSWEEKEANITEDEINRRKKANRFVTVLGLSIALIIFFGMITYKSPTKEQLAYDAAEHFASLKYASDDLPKAKPYEETFVTKDKNGYYVVKIRIESRNKIKNFLVTLNDKNDNWILKNIEEQ